ncbi:hypothetical protein ACLKA7_012987 [Drosophila subpalustris]
MTRNTNTTTTTDSDMMKTTSTAKHQIQMASGSAKLSEQLLPPRWSLNRYQRSHRVKQNKKQKANVLRSAFQIYLPFRPRENIKSHQNFRSVDNEEQDDQILEEDDDDDSTDVSTTIKEFKYNKTHGGGDGEAEGEGGGGGGGGGASDVKSRGGDNRFKRNIKNTRSLIVRKFTSSRRYGDRDGDTDKMGETTKDSEDMKQKREKREEQQEGKPNTKQQQQQQKDNDTDKDKEKNVVMLRTTTL